MKSHILLVEDDQPLAEMVQEFLLVQGFDATIEADGLPPSGVEATMVGDLRVEESNRKVSVAGESVDLTTAEFELLVYLARRAGAVVQRKDIYVDLLEIPYDGLDRSIDLRVSRLRRKLNDDPNQPTRIKSIRGVGYLMAKTA